MKYVPYINFKLGRLFCRYVEKIIRAYHLIFRSILLGKILGRSIRFINRFFLSYIDNLIAPTSSQTTRCPVIFIIGAPRSGSTLAVQVITSALDVGYMSNRHCQWFGCPALAERLLRPLGKRASSEFTSEHGRTVGWSEPAECGVWWYRFFRRKPAYVNLADVDPLKMVKFRRSILGLVEAFDRPVIFKNLYASLRLQAIVHFIPESLFIVIRRDEVENAHSLLEARHRKFGNYDDWFSVEPPHIDILKELPTHEQVVEQIRHIYATIESDLCKVELDENRRLNISYEAFCEDPIAIIDQICFFVERNGYKINRRSASIPTSFERREGVRIDQELYFKMESYVRSSLQ